MGEAGTSLATRDGPAHQLASTVFLGPAVAFDMTDHVDDQAEAERRRTERIEAELREELQGMSYPVESSEVKAAYAEGRIDVPNETESLADAFDRLADTTFDSEPEVREAVMGELTGRAGEEHGDRSEYNPERELQELDERRREG